MRVELVLPLPDSVNRWPKNEFAMHHVKRRYQHTVWAKAYNQTMPPMDPPRRAIMRASFYLRNLRDEDNLKGSLKWVCDALKQSQQSTKWRKGLGEARGYFVDDNPACLTIAEPEQTIDRKNPRLVITIEAA